MRTLCPGLPHTLQHRTLVRPPSAPPPSGCISCTPSPPTAPWPNASCPSYTESDPPSCTRVLLALRRLLSASLALRSAAFSDRRRATWCMTAVVLLVSWSTAANIGVGELLRWLEMRVLISVDCEVASRGFCGVWKTQGCGVAAREFRGVGVRSLTSSLESTLSGS